ncbi:MAG: hypothetical protein RIT81_38130 [Deltaproteobacteria bacterium]
MQAIAPSMHELSQIVLLLDPAEARWDTLREQAEARCRALAAELETLRARLTKEAAHERLEEALASASVTLEELATALASSAGAEQGRRLYGALAKNYDQIARAVETLPGRLDLPVRRLTPRNYARNVFHVAGGLGAALILHFLLTAEQAVWVMVFVAGGAAGLEIVRHRFTSANDFLMGIPLLRRIARPHEYHGINSSTWYAFGLLLSIGLFAKVPVEVACVVLGFADPIASNLGRAYGRTKLFRGKSLVGTSAFFGAALLVASVYLAFTTALPLSSVFALAGAAAIAGAIAELYTVRVDDNFSVPVAVATAVHFAGLWAFVA